MATKPPTRSWFSAWNGGMEWWSLSLNHSPNPQCALMIPSRRTRSFHPCIPSQKHNGAIDPNDPLAENSRDILMISSGNQRRQWKIDKNRVIEWCSDDWESPLTKGDQNFHACCEWIQSPCWSKFPKLGIPWVHWWIIRFAMKIAF